MTDSRIWVLGVRRPEMESIEALLRECGETVRHATAPSGERIRPGQYGAPIHIGDATTVYTVECDPPLACGEPEDEPDAGQVTIDGRRYMAARRCVEVSVIRIDHHRPGDPGYGRPPSEFLEASSIGQVIAELARLDMLPGSWPRHGCVELPVVGRYREWGPCAVTARRQFEGTCCPDAVCACVPEPQDTTWGIELRDRSIASVPRVLVLCAAAARRRARDLEK